MRPSVGRVVHYVPAARVVLLPDECQAALVTAVAFGDPSGDATLTVFPPGEMAVLSAPVPHDEDGKAPGTWHWPERVPG